MIGSAQIEIALDIQFGLNELCLKRLKIKQNKIEQNRVLGRFSVLALKKMMVNTCN